MGFLNRNSASFFVLFLSFAALVPHLNAGIAEFDEYWKERAKIADKEAKMAYVPNPANATDAFNERVGEVLVGTNETRRQLRLVPKSKGPCEALNPIDACWRCDPNWANNRQKLAYCALGFGAGTTGGAGGRIYVVTDPSDDDMVTPKPGTLRDAVVQEGPVWIIFARSMVIRLKQELLINSHKTIDGRGAKVQIAYGAGLTIQFAQNVIIHNIRIHHIVPALGGPIRDSVRHFGLRTRSDGDGISIFGSARIWIDHVSLSNCTDGLIDAVAGATAITISNCKFNYHNDVMLLGANDMWSNDKIMEVTVAFNKFGEGCVQRMPRCRWGFFHVVNNDYTHWQLYAIGGSAHPTILSQGNRFIASNNQYLKEVTKRDYATVDEWKNWNWRSEGDEFLNGAFFRESGRPITHDPLKRNKIIQFRPGKLAGKLTRNAGILDCVVGRAC